MKFRIKPSGLPLLSMSELPRSSPSKLYARCCLDTAAQEAVENAALFGMALQSVTAFKLGLAASR
ncbi:hypothetical protein BGW80DRAFT_595490 [Lactifluus volemus]|nr:hypothetical protein BGW80DRAFT_595490 [Lactifluus volemus]